MADTQIAKPKITLHWLDQSRSQRVVWLLNECKGIDYKIDVYKRVNMLAPPELKKVHPLGKSPVISVEAPALKEPLVIAESGTLTEYLSEHFAQHLIPKRYQEGKEGVVGGETEEWLRYRFYMHYAEGSLMTLLLIGLFIDQIRNAPVPFFIKPITKTIAGRVDSMFLNENYATHFAFLNSQIASSPGGGKFLCGKDLTAADILMSFPLIRGQEKIPAGKNPELRAYIKMLEQHEGYLASIKKIEEVTGEKYQSNL
ncbi:related to glutathione S-transferase [Ramularia collo-cygni]|uniref:Related to glutathione S-transferase n=1 Tax=Ramularia collo-cygni TaxID=112498 RepID=A0A2D3V8G7_9PEZI|nr:related to glutathione S-transferase [Ramularia collo-cygni]CZT19906.1 related to glutathione S-transferase [Ramularia collo-cygni]